MPVDPRDLNHIAILLDVDGTILDIASTPQAVQVPEALRQTLVAMRDRLGGALALVSGRPLADLDAMFKPLRLPAIGGHGAEMRFAPHGAAIARRAAPLDPKLKQRLAEAAARYPGVIVEDKDYSVALHFRLVPKAGLALAHDVRRICEDWGDPSIGRLTGKAVIEVKSSGFNKGMAVRELMAHPPFAGRVPVFVGDDITDEDAFAVVPEFNGHAISVGRKLAGVDHCFQSPADVRHWLERLAGNAVVSP